MTERPVDGIFIKIGAIEVVDLAAQTRDFAVIDLEHSMLSEADAFRLAGHARAIGFPALVRLPAIDRGVINRVLEAGAAGIQLSSVTSTAQVRTARDAMLYAPRGNRSVSLAHGAAEYGALPLGDYLANGDEPLLVAQIETAATVDPLDEIAAAGADVLFIGTTDLSVDLGLDAHQLERRISEVADAARRAEVMLGGFGLRSGQARYRVDSSDLTLLRTAMADGR
jgi:4-hydroxy-2-oxoheptanedioate aldolase